MVAIQNISSGSVYTALDTELVSARKGNSANANGQGTFVSLDVSKAVDKMIQNTAAKGSGNHSLNLMSTEDQGRIQNGQRPLGRPDSPQLASDKAQDASVVSRSSREENSRAKAAIAAADAATGHATTVDGAAAREAGVV